MVRCGAVCGDTRNDQARQWPESRRKVKTQITSGVQKDTHTLQKDTTYIPSYLIGGVAFAPKNAGVWSCVKERACGKVRACKW